MAAKAWAPGSRFSERLVFLPEALHIFFLMVKDLYHLLAVDHFLNIAVQLSQAFLLHGIIGLAPLAAETDVEEHRPIAYSNNKGKLPVENEKDQQCPRHLDKALNHHGKAVVQGVGNRVHVIGKIAHHIAVPPGVKKAQRKGLQMGKQISADIEKHSLSGLHHNLGIAVGRGYADCVNHPGDHDAGDQRSHIPRGQAVDYRADHIGSQQVR